MKKKSCFSLTAALLLAFLPVLAQPSPNQKKQFMDLLLAFPSGFSTINNGAPKTSFNESYYSKVNLEGTKYCRLEKNEKSGKLEFVAIIMADDEIAYAGFQKKFQDWKKIIAGLDFNGAKLVPVASDKYKDNDMYPETAAWRLDNSRNDIDPQYRAFTVWLQLLDLDQGGFMVQLVVTDN